jgi:PiT family inorganic phosphate transporter
MSLIAQHADLYLVLACIFGFFMAWGIGANDVANAMGTSVGSGAIRLGQAILIAGVFEFFGAWLAGGQVTQTISEGLIRPEVFAADPNVLAVGMLAALLGAASFLVSASMRGLTVSTGQSIIGSILGFALVAAGTGPVNWGVIISIALSWVVSPIIAGVLAYLLFESIRRVILARRNPSSGARLYMPLYLFIAAFVICLVTLENGLSHLGVHLSVVASVVGAAGFGLLVALISRLLLQRIKLASGNGDSDRYRNVERIFGYAQIFTAATMAFAHGSNDVANAMGPVAAVVNAVDDPGHFSSQTGVPGWVLLLGGGGIVIGLATYGRKVMQTIGSRITELTPTRGFCAELSAALTVVVATWLGLPVSTTQTLVGAVLGVGLARGMRALDLSVLGSVFAGWVFTLPVAALFAAIYYFILRALIG